MIIINFIHNVHMRWRYSEPEIDYHYTLKKANSNLGLSSTLILAPGVTQGNSVKVILIDTNFKVCISKGMEYNGLFSRYIQ